MIVLAIIFYVILAIPVVLILGALILSTVFGFIYAPLCERHVGKYIFYDSAVWKIEKYCYGYCEDCNLSREGRWIVRRGLGGWVSTHRGARICIDTRARRKYRIIKNRELAEKLNSMLSI